MVLHNCSINCLGFPKGQGSKGNYHGTSCAGIVGATHNSIGLKGVASDVTIIPFRIAKRNGESKSYADVADVINKAWDDFSADILSNSYGDPTYSSSVLVDAIDNALTLGRNSKGSIVIFSSGNNNVSNPEFPGNLPQVISVGSTSLDGSHYSYSGGGTNLDVVAPSGKEYAGQGNVRTLDRMNNDGANNGNYLNTFGGTSASCPQVAGIAALILDADANLTEQEVQCRIQTTATDKGTFGFDDYFGYGIANAYYASALSYMHIEDETITGSQKYSTYDLMYVGPSTTLTSGANVELISSHHIKLQAGMKNISGSKLHAYISSQGPCGSGPMRAANFPDPQNVISSEKTTSLENFDFRVVPNPNNGNFKIIYKTGFKNPCSVAIYNMTGYLLYENNSPDEYEVNLNLNSIPHGLYFVKLKYNEKLCVKKLIKN